MERISEPCKWTIDKSTENSQARTHMYMLESEYFKRRKMIPFSEMLGTWALSKT